MSVKSNKTQLKEPAPTLETMSNHLPTPMGSSSTKQKGLTKAELTSPIQQHPSSTKTTPQQPLILINQYQDGTEAGATCSSIESSLVASSISQVKLKLSPSTLPLPSTGSYNSMLLTNSMSSAISVSSSSCASINSNNLIKASQSKKSSNSIAKKGPPSPK